MSRVGDGSRVAMRSRIVIVLDPSMSLIGILRLSRKYRALSLSQARELSAV